MAKKSPPPAASQSASTVALADPPRPSYAQPPPDVLESDNKAFDDLRELCSNASYNLLDKRDGKWSLLTFGSGQILRTFGGFEEGLEFIRDANLPNVRCLSLPGGIV